LRRLGFRDLNLSVFRRTVRLWKIAMVHLAPSGFGTHTHTKESAARHRIVTGTPQVRGGEHTPKDSHWRVGEQPVLQINTKN